METTPLRLWMVAAVAADAARLARELKHSEYALTYERVDTPAASGYWMSNVITVPLRVHHVQAG